MRVLCLLALLATGCSTPCQQLAHEICACEVGQAAIDACNKRAADENGTVNPNSHDQDVCSSFLDGCDCHALATPQGKRNCGLAAKE